MKLTKLVHSCLLVEHDGKKAIVDPGGYSWASGLVDQSLLKDVDYVLVTHPHPDHIDLTFASVLHELSPNAVWFVTEATKELLSELLLAFETESSFSDVRYIASEHASLAHWGSCPDHTSFVLFERILVSGDCHTLSEMHGADIFAAAINGGPWGSVTTFLDMVARMQKRPKVVIPLHDWHWNEQARSTFYTGLEGALKNLDVSFLPIVNTQSVAVD